MKKVNLLAMFAISFSLISFVACKSSDEFTGTDASIAATASDEAQASSVSDQIISAADDYVNAAELNSYQQVSTSQRVSSVSTADSVIVTIDKTGLTVFPKKITIDFGTTGYTDKRGNVLKGKLYITVSNKMTIAGSSRTFSFSNFFVNDNSVKGSKTVTFLGLKGSADSVSSVGYPSWSVVAKDTISRTDGTVVTWNSNRTRTRISNNGTPNVYWDDTYAITGSSNGVNAKGVAYTMEIDAAKPLTIIGGWKYFVSGAVIITTEKRTALMDYGNGAKDALATVTINGVTKEITLKK
ncbi:MAG: hypothetical protein WCJ61_07980 [Paludibacter sp.]